MARNPNPAWLPTLCRSLACLKSPSYPQNKEKRIKKKKKSCSLQQETTGAAKSALGNGDDGVCCGERYARPARQTRRPPSQPDERAHGRKQHDAAEHKPHPSLSRVLGAPMAPDREHAPQGKVNLRESMSCQYLRPSSRQRTMTYG